MRHLLIALSSMLASSLVQAQTAPTEFERWAISSCVDAKDVGEVVYEKAGSQLDRFAKFDWQQLGCWGKLDASGKEPVGVVEYYYALRRSEYTNSAQAAQKLAITAGMGAEAYRLYFKHLDGKWTLVAYQSMGNNLSALLSSQRPPSPILYGADFRVRKGIWEVAVKAMERMTQAAANTKCSQGEDGKVVCAPAT